ncbi:MAG: hypothetical protein KA184_21385 [Candidatus Hydrogenedentes bacterium]|nr:hypothetical protein [Candidatus Hydrogenedentota bacterium]
MADQTRRFTWLSPLLTGSGEEQPPSGPVFTRRQALRESAAVAAVALFLFFVMTWPLLPRFFTHIIGVPYQTDNAIAVWNLSWAQLQGDAWFPNPYWTDRLFHPLGSSLAYHGSHYFLALLTAPITWTLGLVPAFNFACLWSFLTSAVVCYWLCRFLGLPRGACWIAALLFAFSPFRMWRVQHHINFLATDWAAAYGLCLMALLHTRRWRLWGTLAGLCMTGCMYTDFTYPILLIIITAFFGLYFFRPWRDPLTARRLVLGLGLAAGLAAVLTLPIMLSLRSTNALYNYYVERGNIELSADLLSFVSPPGEALLRPVYDLIVPRLSFFRESCNFLGFLPLLLMLLGLFAFRRDARFRFWKWTLLILAVLSLGPFLKVGGEVDLFRGTWGNWRQEPESFRLTLPYAFFSYVPLVNNARGPERFHGVTTLPFSLIAAAGAAVLLGRMRKPWLRNTAAAAMAAACLLEYAAVPLPVTPMHWGAFDAVRDDPEDVAVADGRLNDRIAIEHQAYHHKRVVTGHVGRIAPEIHAYMTTAPLLRELTTKWGTQEAVEAYAARPAAPEMTRRILEFLNIRYFVQNGPRDAYLLKLFEGTLPYTLVGEDERSKVYLLGWNSPGGVRPRAAMVGRGEWSVYFAHGWGQWDRIPEVREGRGVLWPASPMASVLFKVDTPQSVGMAFETYVPESAQGVRMAAFVNGRPVRELDVPPGFRTFRVAFDPELVRPGLNSVEFRWPYEDGRYSDADTLDIPACLYLTCGATGKGLQGGILEILGQWVYSNARGYNILELSDDGGRLLRTAQFDAYTDGDAPKKLAGHIAAIPEGRLVVFMGAGETSQGMTQEAVDALGTLGSAFDARNKYGWSHAGVGRKGMKPGQALESFNGESITVLAPGRCGFTGFQFAGREARPPSPAPATPETVTPAMREPGAES